MAQMKAMGVIFEKAVELQGLRDVYANVLQGEGEIVHDQQGWILDGNRKVVCRSASVTLFQKCYGKRSLRRCK